MELFYEFFLYVSVNRSISNNEISLLKTVQKQNSNNITTLNQRLNIQTNIKLNRLYRQFEQLISELNKRELPQDILLSINQDIESLNKLSDTDKKLKKELQKKLSSIIALVEKKLKIVPKNHYRNTYLAIGIVFGIALGIMATSIFGKPFSTGLNVGIGLPIGMVIGLAIGSRMDKKATEEGRQLDIEI